ASVRKNKASPAPVVAVQSVQASHSPAIIEASASTKRDRLEDTSDVVVALKPQELKGKNSDGSPPKKKGRKEKNPSKGSTARSTAYPGCPDPSASVDIHFPLSPSTDVAKYIDGHYKFDWDSESIKDLSLEETGS
ncbi:hypothetical protein A2U01_0052991, partial [Trifolium medium]|nr:hypothetical protein [Trifolium medium]